MGVAQKLAIPGVAIVTALVLTGIPGQPLSGDFWTANAIFDFCLVYLSLTNIVLALAYRRYRRSWRAKIVSKVFVRAVLCFLVGLVLMAWIATDPNCYQQADQSICTSWLLNLNFGSFTDCPTGHTSCGIQHYRNGEYADVITGVLLFGFIILLLSPPFLLHVRQQFGWRIWDLPSKLGGSCCRTMCRILVLALLLLSVLGGLCNRVGGGWRANYGILSDDLIFGEHGYLTGRMTYAVPSGLLVLLATGNPNLFFLTIMTTYVGSLPRFGCYGNMARNDPALSCDAVGMFDWMLGTVGANTTLPTIPMGACTVCGGMWQACVNDTTVSDFSCNVPLLQTWRRAWAAMWLRGFLWWVPTGLGLYAGGFGASLCLGGPVLMPMIYELAWHLPFLSEPSSFWPWGPKGYQMLGTPIDWAEFLLGTSIWCLIVLSILSAEQVEVPQEEEIEDSQLRPFIVWAEEPQAMNSYSPSSSWQGNKSRMSHSTSSTTVIVRAVPWYESWKQSFNKILPLSNPDGELWARIARGVLVVCNWCNLLITIITLGILILAVAENN